MQWRTVVLLGAVVLAGCSAGEDASAFDHDTDQLAATETTTLADDGVTTSQSSLPTNGGATTSTTAEPELPDLAGETLGLRGLGPIQIGASVSELAARGFPITNADCEVPYMRFEPNGVVAVQGGAHGNPTGDDTLTGLYFWFDSPGGSDARNHELRTHSGIGEGSTRADVLATYGERVVERSFEFEFLEGQPEVENQIVFTPRDSADAGLLMIFSFDDAGYLRGIRTGELTSIEFPYLCA